VLLTQLLNLSAGAPPLPIEVNGLRPRAARIATPPAEYAAKARKVRAFDQSPADIVLCECAIAGNDRKIVDTRLRDQKPIEWIEMMQRQRKDFTP